MTRDWMWRPVRLTGWKIVLLGFLGLATSAALIGTLVHGRFYMMDDPTILSWLRPDGRLHLADLPHIIRSSEIFMYGSDSRCRPVYWLLRMAETTLWGDRTALWFGMRVLLFGGVLSAFAWSLVAVVGPAWTALLMLYVTAQFYWGDVWAHASLGEQYGSVAVALIVVSAIVFRGRITRRVNADVPLMLMSLGTVIAVGSKEHFAFLLVPLYIALYTGRRAGIVRTRSVAAAIFATLFTIYVGVGVILGLKHVGADQYGNAGGLGHRLSLLTGTTSQLICVVVLALALAAFMLRVAARRRGPSALAAIDESIRENGLLALVVVAMLFAQIVYYDGDWPRFGGRYDFPGRLAEVIAAAAAIVVTRRLLAEALLAKRTAIVASLALAVVVCWSVWHHGFHARAAAKSYVATTNTMYGAIRAALDRYSGDSTVPVVLVSRDAGDYEAAVWTSAAMPFYGGSNPVFLRPPDYTTSPMAGGAPPNTTTPDMAKMAREGAPEYRLRPFTEFAAALARANGRCAAILLRQYAPMIAIPCVR